MGDKLDPGKQDSVAFRELWNRQREPLPTPTDATTTLE